MTPRFVLPCLLAACQPTTPSVGPEPASASSLQATSPTATGASEPEPIAPEPIAPEPLPPPTWEWALSVAPELAELSQTSPAPEAYERFAAWFPGTGERTLYLRLHEQCFEVRGSVARGFSYRESVTTEGNTRRRTSYDLQIEPGGIIETGPGGITYERDAKGRWQEVGGFGTGCMEVLVPAEISRVEHGVAYFEGYGYSLTAECDATIEQEQRCEDGSTRTCSRCGGVYLHPHAANRGWGRMPRIVAQGQPTSPTVHDCSQPCPVDEWTPRLQPLNEVLKGRRFYGKGAEQEGVLFQRGKDCRRAAQRVKQ